MQDFLVDGSKTYSYSALLEAVCSNDYFPLLQTQDLFLYFSNLIKALCNDRPLILLDSDLSSSEISNIGIDNMTINEKVSIDVRHFASVQEVVDAINCSSSDITIFTSGTTGQPKKVVHCMQSLSRFVRRGEKYESQVWAYAYNPTHIAGLQVFLQAFENKNLIVNVFNCSRSYIYSSIDKYKVTHISATPTFYRLLLPFERSYPTVQRITLGGEKSENSLYDQLNRIFPLAKTNNIYASTEAGSLLVAKGEYFQIPIQMRGLLKVVNDELLIHYSLLGKSDNFEMDGDFYHSGDIVEWVDKENLVFKFVSRKNQLVNVGGYKVNPAEVEEAINNISGVRQSLVYGRINSVLGNVLCADIVLENGTSMSEQQIRFILKDNLQDFKIPRRIKFVDSLALTRTGKLKRS